MIEGVNYDIAFCQMCLETGFAILVVTLNQSKIISSGIGAIGKWCSW
jgi:hypothetical protein